MFRRSHNTAGIVVNKPRPLYNCAKVANGTLKGSYFPGRKGETVTMRRIANIIKMLRQTGIFIAEGFINKVKLKTWNRDMKFGYIFFISDTDSAIIFFRISVSIS